MTWPDESGTHQREWGLEELTAETVRDRWGSGEFKVYWFELADSPDPAIARQGRGASKVVQFDPEPPAARVSAPQHPVAPQLGAFAEAMQFMAMADERASRQLSSILTAAGAIAGRQSGGLDSTTLQLLIQQQQQSTQLLIQQMQQQHEASMGALRAELGALRAELDTSDDNDDDDEPSPVAAVAKAAAPLIKPGTPIGDGLKAAIANYVAENPAQLFELLGKVPGVIEKLANMAQTQPQRPRAVPVVRENPAPPPPPLAPINGINAVLSQPQKETVPSDSAVS